MRPSPLPPPQLGTNVGETEAEGDCDGEALCEPEAEPLAFVLAEGASDGEATVLPNSEALAVADTG